MAVQLENVKALPNPLDIDRLIGRVRNRIAKVGVEIEGGWRIFPQGEKYAPDASVFKNPSEELKNKLRILKIQTKGELPSRPMLPSHMTLWLKRVYPNYIDQSCGLHLHMSFKSLNNYERLMTLEYPLTVRVYLKKWANKEGLPDSHPIWDRLSGKNEFCNHMFFPTKQIACKQKDYDHFRQGNRYTDIAYRFGTHGTVECRVLPMFDNPELSGRALKHVIDITNAFLVKVARRGEKVEGILDDISTRGFVERDVEEL